MDRPRPGGDAQVMGLRRWISLFVLVVLIGPLPAWGQSCRSSSTGLIPLTDLGPGSYLGEKGGLYPEGSNEIPADHLAIGLERSAQVVPRNPAGSPDPAGSIGLVSFGVSNTFQEFEAFMSLLSGDERINPLLVLVNGAQGAKPLTDWADGQGVWETVDERLAATGVAAPQIQVAWLKIPDAEAGSPTMEAAAEDAVKLGSIVADLDTRFPNLELVFLSSRIYGGFINEPERTEPSAYQDGFAVRWAIEEQLAGTAALDPRTAAPWMAWGAYLWADGSNPRSDGLTWECEDFERGGQRGVHPSASGSFKVAGLLYDFFSSSPVTVPWFLADGIVPPASSTVTAGATTTMSVRTTSAAVTSLTSSSPTTVAIPADTGPPAASEGGSNGLLIGAAALIGLVVGAYIFRRRGG
ncbi:MAG: hypothetical protein ACRDWA_09070 [Acidimicrobiia bacterium]